MTVQVFINAVLRFVGLPYRWGGDDPINGYDCSGFVQECLAMLGLDPAGDQTAQALHDFFNTPDRSIASPRLPGTLVFFGASKTSITHVAMMIDQFTMIEAGGGGSKTVSEAAAASQNAYIRLRPFTTRKDLVAVITPKGLPWRAS